MEISTTQNADSPLAARAVSNRRKFATIAVFLFAAVTVAIYYRWNIRVTGGGFEWGPDLSGYYNYLGRAFAQGQLHLPIEPSPELLALPNPWDPTVDWSLKAQDMVLYNGRYYLYHGAGPAVFLFTPWRLVTGRDLSERFALFLLCFGGFLFSCGALIKLLALADARPSPFLLAVMFLALGISQGAPFLLNRIMVYEIAIGSGYFCLSAAAFFFVQAIGSRRGLYWLAASGLMFGFAIASRPHLGLAGAIAFAGLVIYFARSQGWMAALRSRELISFTVPLALLGFAVVAYNYLRFGAPFEFGYRYLLSGPFQNYVEVRLHNLLPGLYFLLLCAPEFTPVFPWVQLIFRYPFDNINAEFPHGYFIEPTVGALWAAPFIVAALFIPSARRLRMSKAANVPAVRIFLWVIVASSGAVLLFLALNHFMSHRYEIDFIPLAVLAALASIGIHIARSSGFRRYAIAGALVLSVAASILANIAFGIEGPYNDVLKFRPEGYVRLARMFSPIEHHRPLVNPKLTVDFVAEIVPQANGFREPLLAIGERHHWGLIYVEHTADGIRLVSQAGQSKVARDLGPQAGKPLEIHVTYSPESSELTTVVNRLAEVVHPVKTLITAPSQVTVGENRPEHETSYPRFTGRIYNVRKKIGGG